MHPAIADFPSQHFYDGEVTSGTRSQDRPIPLGFPWPNAATPVAFVRVCDSTPGSPYNIVGATEAADAVDEGFYRNQAGGIGRGAGMRGRLESKGGTEAAVAGREGAALGTSYCNHREAHAVAVALEMIIAGGDVEVTTGRRGAGVVEW